MSETASRFQKLLHNKIFMGWFTVTFGGIGIFLVSKAYMNNVKKERFNTLDDTDYVAGAYEGPPTTERKSKFQGGGSSRSSRQPGDILHYGGFFRRPVEPKEPK